MRRTDQLSGDLQRMERQLLRRFVELTSEERANVIAILEQLAAADESLADIRIGLTSVTVDFCFLDQSPCRMLTYNPLDLLKLLKKAADGQTERYIRLAVE